MGTKGTCSVTGCEKPIEKRQWCGMHYQRWAKYDDPGDAEPRRKPRTGTCIVAACNRPILSNERCKTHYERFLRGQEGGEIRPWGINRIRTVCSVEGCDRVSNSRGWCIPHYKRWQRYDDPLAVRRKGASWPSGPVHIEREQLAWAAGFFDGEGHTGQTSTSPRKDGSHYRNPIMMVAQTDTEVLEHFKAALGGIGTISGPRIPKNPNQAPSWNWHIAGYELVQATTAMLWPWLGTVKRNQAMKALLTCTVRNPLRYKATGRSQFRGVVWHRGAQKWQANGNAHGVTRYLGLFTDEREAARAVAAFHERLRTADH